MDLMGGVLGYVIGFLGVFLVAYWTFDERDQTEAWADTIERVGERSKTATGGVLGAATSLASVLTAIFLTIGAELTSSTMRITELIATDPVLSGGVATGLAGVSANAGWIPLKTWQLIALVAAFLIVGTVWRERTT